MKTMRFLLKLLLPLGMMVILFQGCYTQLVTSREEEPNYQQEQTGAQNDTNYSGEYNDNWQSHPYLGFSYYYPAWQSYWSWDYGCIYPSRWDPWFWGPVYYPEYAYYPHHFGYWNYYSGHSHYFAPTGYTYSSRPFATRNSGFQRSGNTRQSFGGQRSVSAGISRRDVSLPRAAGSVNFQSGSNGSVRASRGASSNVSTSRQSAGGRYNPSVQQPRHRDQSSSPINRFFRIGSSRSNGRLRNQGTGNQSSAPSYSPRPSPQTSSPQSSPAPKNDGGGRSGGGERSSGGGRDSGRQR
jgi:hypothetical protein